MVENALKTLKNGCDSSQCFHSTRYNNNNDVMWKMNRFREIFLEFIVSNDNNL